MTAEAATPVPRPGTTARRKGSGFSARVGAAGLRKSDLEDLPKGDWRKRAIGRAIRRSTIMPVIWIAEVLRMGDPKRAASLVQSNPDPQWGREWKKAKGILAGITKNVGSFSAVGRKERQGNSLADCSNFRPNWSNVFRISL